MKVVFPRPDSPATLDSLATVLRLGMECKYHTIIVKAAPRFATILCLSGQLDYGMVNAMVDSSYLWLGSCAQRRRQHIDPEKD